MIYYVGINWDSERLCSNARMDFEGIPSTHSDMPISVLFRTELGNFFSQDSVCRKCPDINSLKTSKEPASMKVS